MTADEQDLNLQAWVRLTAHEKLVLKITRATRCIFMSFAGGVLTFRAVFDRPPSELDLELISDALGETAGAFVEIADHRFEHVTSDQPFEDLEKLDYWLFVRAEEVDQG